MSRLWSGGDDRWLKEKTVLIAVRESWAELLVRQCRDEEAVALKTHSPEELFPMLEFGDPDFLVLEEGFGRKEEGKDPVLEWIQHLSSDRRRDLFVVYIAPQIKSGDPLTAFSLSVNLVLNPEDLNGWVKVLGRSYRHWKNLYQGFFQVRQEVNGY
jgi:hypothetical protein